MSFKTRILTVAAVMAFGIFTSASAQQEKCSSIVLPDGTVLTCDVSNGQKVYVDDQGNVYPVTSTGVGQFKIVKTGTNPCVAELEPQKIDVTSSDPVLGTITTTLDATRTSTNSRIESNVAGTEFPATENIYFYANATISSKKGVVYQSINEVHLTSDNVNSFNPHVNEQFTLAEKVDFEDVKNPGVVAFTLSELTVTLGRAK